MSEELSPEMWLEETAKGTSITTEEIDELCQTWFMANERYAQAKAVATDAYNEAERLEGKVIEALEQAGKTKYSVDGIGTFSLRDSMSVRVPATIEQKRQLFDYIQSKYGDTVFWEKISINSRTLNSFYNSELEVFNELAREGKASGDFHFPGVEAPTAQRALRLTKERKK